MAEPHVVSGLVAKHAELAGLIQFHRTEIKRVASDLQHLDATLKLFAPETDLRSLGSKRVNSSRVSGLKGFDAGAFLGYVLEDLAVGLAWRRVSSR